MNTWGLIVLLGLLAAFAVRRTSEILNLSRLASAVPPDFTDLYDTATYRRAQSYTRARTLLGMAAACLDLVIVVAFWLFGGFGYLDEAIRSLEWGSVPTGLLYLGVLFLALALVDVPFSLYSTFVIEERYGFNRTSLTTWITDRVKGLLVSLVLGVPLLAAVLALFDYGGSSAWLWAWLLAGGASLLFQIILPTWVLPLFNRLTPLEEGELREAVTDYARRVGFPLRGLFVMDGSRRSSKANAFFTGFGRAKRIALFDTLIERHSVDELVAVLGHEIGHYKRRHVLKGTVLGILELGVGFALLALVMRTPALFESFGVAQPSPHVALAIFGLVLAPLQLLVGTLGQMVSRRQEFQADGFAAETTCRPDSMMSALRTLSRDSLTNLTPHPVYVALNYSHPPVVERVRALQEWARQRRAPDNRGAEKPEHQPVVEGG